MKSDIITPDRISADSRQSNRRRRMSKPVTNGDVSADGDSDRSTREVSVVAAIQDHISCTKPADYLKSQDIREEKVTNPCELDHMYANCEEPRPSQAESQQVKKLRELLLLHLDLIQQQEEQLRVKDRQINTLKQENETIKQKLERMERKVALFRQKEKTHSSEASLSENQHDPEDAADGVSLRKDALSKSFGDKRTRRKHLQSHNVDSSEETCDPNQKQQETEKSLGKRNRDVLRTDLLYYSNYGSSVRTLDSPLRDEEVVVPSWRLHPVTSCYQMEGTENLDDEIFLKRHLKLELDERRRKRWDIQRIREQRLNEKLKRGRAENCDQSSSQEYDFCSFSPNPEDAIYLEVSDTVPVCAFGYPVPSFHPCEFSLPWLVTNAKEKPEKQERLRSAGPSPKKQRTNDSKR